MTIAIIYNLTIRTAKPVDQDAVAAALARLGAQVITMTETARTVRVTAEPHTQQHKDICGVS